MPLHFHKAADRQMNEADRRTMGVDAPDIVRPFLSLWGRTETPPLISLPELAKHTGTGHVLLKDEGQRLNQGSFKALGGAYAVMAIFKSMLEEHLGSEVGIAQLTSPTAREFARSMTFCCATDGNHGKSVAAGARLLGCRAVIFVHGGVTAARAAAIGADEVIRVEGNYDHSVAEAERISAERKWILVSDTSWPGYETIPSLVAQGYTVLADEALQQFALQGLQPPTHAFLQAGVGGFASSVSGHLSEALGRDNITTIIVEPDRAACLFETARAGELRSFTPTQPTIMAMLECYKPSLVAWRILQRTADAFMTVSEEDAKNAMRSLAFRGQRRQGIVAGESGAAGLAGLQVLSRDANARAILKLDEHSRVLLVNTETATDPASYEEIVGASPQSISGVLARKGTPTAQVQ
ncbi:Diaminopropionate ammonia-lyase [Mesorhizobium metallidurans STM 2683]|uniref:Diaminopropionate ammonia-lyase n=1 Tax=Mesorhizobium metallidurans STM 2683 TaxID=1297569 RepID=M5EPZ9_9HYPH|nr:diaminopropionate ammonia-lyase [Mesorhizobium metallidurans]CCV06392.1 Diaminopropionate ammonia-lyase [Mesorhizobium metallidurans STM 2683]